MLSAHFVRVDSLYDISSGIYAIIVILFGLLSPQLSSYILGKLPKVNVDKNLLNLAEIQALHKRLDSLMESKKLFKDPDLNLKGLANAAAVTPHQLSWFINSEFGLGFSVYINRFRLESVRKELLENPDGTILEIAMANGFGSKTTFNSLFLNMYGVSPRDYRRMNGNIPT
jgi:AraC-like DNA-binding protein